MYQLHHRLRAAEETLAAQRIASEIRVQHLDCHTLLRHAVIRVPDYCEATLTHDVHEEETAITQGVPCSKLPSFAQLSAQLEDFSVDVVRSHPHITQLIPPSPSVVESLAQLLYFSIWIDRSRSLDKKRRGQHRCHREP